MTSPRRVSPAERLLVALCGTEERRNSAADEIRTAGGSVDWEELRQLAITQGLLPIVADRLERHLPAAAPQNLLDDASEIAHNARLVGVIGEQMTTTMLDALGTAGIPAVSLKGPLLASLIYGDTGLRRRSVDIDLIVARRTVPEAIEALESVGYTAEAAAQWQDGLPGIFECTLLPSSDWQPPVDLHWKVHWYEQDFTPQLLANASRNGNGLLTPAPADELALLLLAFAKDGLLGLDLPVDIAAWWDRRGSEVPQGALDDVIERSPELERALLASALVLDRLVGLPSRRLISARKTPTKRVRTATGLATWRVMNLPDWTARVALIDLLLAPRRGARAFVRRHVLLPPRVISEIYELPDTARFRRLWRRYWYAAVKIKNVVPAGVRAVWNVRRLGPEI